MREREYTNAFTVNDLFPDMDPAIALKKELRRLTVGDYIRTVTDIRFPKKSEMREFGRVFKGKRDVYIKIRVELFLRDGCHTVFVMSFHYAERPMDRSLFPYSKKEE